MKRAFASEQLTIDDSVTTLTSSVYQPSEGQGAYCADIVVEGGDFRYTVDGTTPTTTRGSLVKAGMGISLESRAEIAGFKAIRTGTLSATCEVTYYNKT